MDRKFKITILIKTVLFFIIMLVQNLNAQSELSDIDSLITNGFFKQATSSITNRLIDPSTDIYQKYLLNFRLDLMNRIRLDFKKTREDILPGLRKYYYDITEEQISGWEKSGNLEMRIIDGVKYYFNYAVPNLFRINKEAKKKKMEVDDPTSDNLDEFLNLYIPKVKKDEKSGKLTFKSREKIKLKYSLTVDPDAVPDGEIIRCWLPYPREGNGRQRNIKLLSVNSDDYIVAPNSSLQRTLYMEKKAIKGTPTVFTCELSYDAYAALIAGKLIDYTVPQVYPDSVIAFTKEVLPHIVFTQEIKKLSEAIIGKETNPLKKAKLIYDWISNTIPWASALEYSTIPNISMYCIQNGHGDCGIQSLFFMTLCRYNGIPVKWQSGWMFHPGSLNLHDWAELYVTGVGWVPIDQSFGLQNFEQSEQRDFFFGNTDAYHFIVNDSFSEELFPAKIYPRSETVDFQRGEVEWKGGNLYFNKWDYHMEIEYLSEEEK